jgi:aryl-alcohol dehydrogenase-like predicted oxidoreductase
LQTDYVYLYQLHSPSAQFMQSAAFVEALGTLEKLKGHAKIRFYGVATEVPEDAPFCLAAHVDLESSRADALRVDS